MGLAHAPQHELVGLGVVVDAQGRVLGAGRLSAQESLSSSALLCATIATGSSGSGSDRPQHPGVVDVGQRVPGLRAGEPADRSRSRPRAGRGHLRAPEGVGQRADPLVLVVVLVAGGLAEERGEVGRRCTVWSRTSVPEDPDEAEPADVRVAGGLDDLRHQRPVGVAGDRAAAAPEGLNTSGEGCSAGDGNARTARSSNSVQPAPVAEQPAHHGEECRAGHRPLEVRDQHVLGNLLAADVAVHQRLVLRLLDHALDQLAPQLQRSASTSGPSSPVRPSMGAARPELGRRPGPARTAASPARRRYLPCLAQHGVVVGPRLVELGDDDGSRHAHGRALEPQRPRRVVDVLVGGDDEQRAVGGAQAGRSPRSRRTRGCR